MPAEVKKLSAAVTQPKEFGIFPAKTQRRKGKKHISELRDLARVNLGFHAICRSDDLRKTQEPYSARSAPQL